MNIQLTKNVADFLGTPVQHFIGGHWNSTRMGVDILVNVNVRNRGRGTVAIVVVVIIVV